MKGFKEELRQALFLRLWGVDLGSDEYGMLGRIHSKLVVEAVMQELLQRLPVSDETMVDNSASKGHDAALRLSFVPHIGSV